ncbi:hypothetical protein FBF28_03545 [Candidatus Saccharibacteria bacterium oral taxon 488]|nr:hypothetical protein FBF28_03545 [Candidatus Saccharibacteria bacterium oral taxon 488]
MNDASKQGTEEFKSRWVVPTEESRAELAEWGLRTREEQNELYHVMDERFERVYRARLKMVEMSRKAAEEALGEVAVGESKNTVCKHRERQATVREILQTNGGSMYWSDLIGVMTKPPHSFFEGEAVMALIDSPKGFQVDHFNLIVSISDR